ncbi:LLM class flavin-dependent oxidoreductase [Rhizobium rhizogenes]|uniref:LLM class flavin-dependent oxidoreductase n=1 Tax=Rhizobium rhizogenes TaxID=359 RepID=UPI0015716611|nr:LLM class flavin-dependent oxidoreductase [Rhizobium rhizogenes]NTI26698.1 LLM class flavin-dependent oxidoreductase [Rhizobium rhizogenes]QTG08611.1 LLM class flavin-dependent oxidoreductase [Rhizobium rhizogenes]
MSEDNYVNLTLQNRRENPMAASTNLMKLGVFSINTDGGMAITRAPERLHGDDWLRNLEIAQIADRAGFETIIPAGRWRGFGGERNSGGVTYETYAWAAGLSALTKQIGIVTTSHLPTVHPVFAAKQAATIDHISGGRFGLNVLCGWYISEMRMFSNSIMEHDERYDYAEEWLEIATQAWSTYSPFDFKGRFFDLQQVMSEPKPLNRPYLINAGSSPRGKRFCAQYCDAAFIVLKYLQGEESVRQQISSYKDYAKTEFGRDLKIWCYGYVVQGDTEQNALDYLDYYANKLGDDEECNAVMAAMGIKAENLHPEYRQQYCFHFKAGFVGVPLVGTPEMIVDQFRRYSDMGVDGIALGWLDYHKGIKEFVEKVIPLMEASGLRAPFEDTGNFPPLQKLDGTMTGV